MLFSGAYILWPDPLIVSVMEPTQLDQVLRMRAPKHVLFSPTWIWTARNLPHLYKLRLQAPGHGKTLHFMRCASQTDRMLRALKFQGDLVSISSYVNEHLFRITGEPKKYDAVYAASMFPYKRMHLAAKVKNLMIQTYGNHRNEKGELDLPSFEPSVAHATYNRGWVAADQVVANFNQSRVGLSLSKCEGAMLASVEYMLCGLPQVSTPCRGGREQFFDDRYVTVAPANADAIAKAVDEMVARNVDPELVRRETLEKLKAHRLRLCDYVIGAIREANGTPPTVDKLWERIFGGDGGTTSCFVHHRDFAARGLV